MVCGKAVHVKKSSSHHMVVTLYSYSSSPHQCNVKSPFLPHISFYQLQILLLSAGTPLVGNSLDISTTMGPKSARGAQDWRKRKVKAAAAAAAAANSATAARSSARRATNQATGQTRRKRCKPGSELLRLFTYIRHVLTCLSCEAQRNPTLPEIDRLPPTQTSFLSPCP